MVLSGAAGTRAPGARRMGGSDKPARMTDGAQMYYVMITVNFIVDIAQLGC
jgi:hypothetical protein